MLPPDEYKLLQQQWITGLTGTSIWEVAAVTSIFIVGVLDIRAVM